MEVYLGDLKGFQISDFQAKNSLLLVDLDLSLRKLRLV